MYQFELDLSSKEEWRPIPGHENYLVSNKGRVRGVFSGAILSQQDKRGYRCVNLCVSGRVIGKRKVKKSVHRLVAFAFILNPQGKPHINHLNGIKHDNRAENLEWVTLQENIAHAWTTGLMSHRKGPRGKRGPNGPHPSMQGERHHSARLNADDIRRIFDLRQEGKTHKQIASIFKTTRRYIGTILSGGKWKHLNLTKSWHQSPAPTNLIGPFSRHHENGPA